MALSHGGLAFDPTHLLHGGLVDGPWDVPLTVHRFPGVAGEDHLTNPPLGRDLSCGVALVDFDTAQQARDWVDLVNARAGTLTGTLTVTGTLACVEKNCTFLGLAVEPPGVRYDPASGKFRARGLLRWRQRGRNTDALG